MNDKLANILRTFLLPSIFADKVGGLVKPLTLAYPVGEGDEVVLKTFPVDCNVTDEDCQNESEKLTEYIPNGDRKSIIYFEDLGTTPKEWHGNNRLVMVSTLRLVTWLNVKKFSKTLCTMSDIVSVDIIDRLPRVRFNSDWIMSAEVRITGIEPKSPNIFSKYTYDESKRQYLLYPYDYFALILQVEFHVNPNCVAEFVIDPEIC